MTETAPEPPPLPAWFDASLPPVNDDFTRRVVLADDAGVWRDTRHAGLEARVLEHIGGAEPRLAAQLRLAAGASSASLGDGIGTELLVQRGEVAAGANVWPSGLYVRLPAGHGERFDEIRLGSESGAGDADGAGVLLYVASGHIAPTDGEARRIDTADDARWLPGPIEGVEVLPLHGHGSGNVMLIRWLGAVAFRTKLDPLGEEMLVLEGCLHDAEGDYPENTWIRNPVPAWQSWAGDPGTVVYYKNGHFATSDASLPGPGVAPGRDG